MGAYLSPSVPFHQGSLTEKTSNQASSQEGDQTVFPDIMETEIKAMVSLLFFLNVRFLVLRRGCAEITFPHCWGPLWYPAEGPAQPCPERAHLPSVFPLLPFGGSWVWEAEPWSLHHHLSSLLPVMSPNAFTLCCVLNASKCKCK